MPAVRYADVPRLVLDEVPEFRPLFDEHLNDNDEVLAHVLFGDLSRFTVAAYKRGDAEVTGRVVRLMERLLEEGDERTTNLVGVSFVENIGPDDVDEGFFALYGHLLRADLQAIWGITPPDANNANPS